jgi:hypothetical protein
MKQHLLKIAAIVALLGFGRLSAALVHVTGDITTDMTWTADNEYVLDTIILVKNGATLTVEPGTIIRGQPKGVGFNPGTLAITAGSKIHAVGTPAAPIIFTTAALDDGQGRPVGGLDDPANATRAAFTGGTQNGVLTTGVTLSNGAFLDANPKTAPLPPVYQGNGQKKMFSLTGGVIILGKAPINVAGVAPLGAPVEGRAYIEGLPQNNDTIYGGDFPLDSSGSIAYFSIRHGGAIIGSNNEINGLTMGGVGAGTRVEFIDIYCNSDDGVEIFGGTVNVNNLNITYADDDGFDVDQGWTGRAQFVFCLQGLGYGDRGGEFDGDDQAAGAVTANFKPLQYSAISNMTVVNRGAGIGIQARSAFGGEIFNSIVTGAATGITVTGAATGESANNSSQARALRGELVFKGNTVHGNTNAGGTFTSFDLFANTPAGNTGNVTLSPGFRAFDHTVANGINPVPLLNGGDTAAVANVAPLGYGFQPVGYRGAFNPQPSALLWTTGWTALNLRGVLVDSGNDGL